MEPNAANLLAQKLARELYRIAQAYGQQHPFRYEDLVHDLAVMLQMGALNSVSLKFVRSTGRREVLAEYDYALHAGAPRFLMDTTQGIGIVPLTPPFEMVMVVNRDTCGGAYESRLRMRWSDAPRYERRSGFEHRDGNTASRTGGRASKQVFMDDSLRRRGQVKFYVPAKRYGFIVAADGLDIFFHANDLNGLEPQPGQSVTFLPLATPRGMQAKDVRPG